MILIRKAEFVLVNPGETKPFENHVKISSQKLFATKKHTRPARNSPTQPIQPIIMRDCKWRWPSSCHIVQCARVGVIFFSLAYPNSFYYFRFKANWTPFLQYWIPTVP